MTRVEDDGAAPAGAPAASGAFAEQLAAIRRDGEGPAGRARYRVDVAPHWRCPVVPHGGLMASVAARAMADELGRPDQSLRSLTTVFAAAVPAGPVTIDVEVLRRGRSMSQLTATVRAEGAEAGHTTVAVFGGARTGFAFTDRARPEVLGPEGVPSFRDPLPEGVEDDGIQVPFWEHLEGRPVLGHAPWDDYMPEASDRGYWYRFDEPPFRSDGTLDPLALVTLCDTMPGAVGERVGPGQAEGWWAPSTDLTVHLLGEARSDWQLAHMRAHRAGEGYASAEVAVWDPETGLVAYGTQVMFFTFSEPPTPDQLVPRDQR